MNLFDFGGFDIVIGLLAIAIVLFLVLLSLVPEVFSAILLIFGVLIIAGNVGKLINKKFYEDD